MMEYIYNNGVDTVIKDYAIFQELLKSGVLDDEEWTKDQKETDTTYAVMPGSRRLEYFRFYEDSKMITYINSSKFNFLNAHNHINKVKRKKIKKEGDVYDYFLSKEEGISFFYGVSLKYINYKGAMKKDSIIFKLSLMDSGHPYSDSVKVFNFYPFKENLK